MQLKILYCTCIAFLFLLVQGKDCQSLRFSKITCVTHQPSFATFPYCYMKSVNRSYQYFSVKVKLLQVPVTNVSVSFAILKRANGMRPFLYNYSVDACQFLRSKRRNPVHIFLFNLLGPYTNMNHTCPYDHDLVVEKLDTNHWAMSSGFAAFPSGYYCLNTEWFAYKNLKATVRGCITLNNQH